MISHPTNYNLKVLRGKRTQESRDESVLPVCIVYLLVMSQQLLLQMHVTKLLCICKKELWLTMNMQLGWK